MFIFLFWELPENTLQSLYTARRDLELQWKNPLRERSIITRKTFPSNATAIVLQFTISTQFEIKHLGFLGHFFKP